jgi:excisionase family DNA binding protein
MGIPRQLSVMQVSAKLQCANSTVRKLIAKGALRATRIGERAIRISERNLQTYLDARANAATTNGSDRREGRL